MLIKSHRFHGYNSLRGVYQRGQSVRGTLVSLKFSRRDPTRPYRVAVVVSRKVSKSAVVRNRIRRRIFEIARRADANIAPGTDLVFTVFSEQAAELEATKLEAVINGLIQEAAGKP
jgi:ribonuclease P protein component